MPSHPQAPRGKRQRLQRWSRAVVLWALGSFALTQLAVGGFIEFRGPVYRDPAFFSRAEYLARRQREAPGAPLVLFLGSSRVTMGVRTRVIEPRLRQALGGPV